MDEGWLPNFHLTLKDEVILCSGSDTHRCDHHDAGAQSGDQPGVAPPYIDSELNFEPLYLKD